MTRPHTTSSLEQPKWLKGWTLQGTLKRPSCPVLGPFSSFPTFLVRLRQELEGLEVPVADWARFLRICILGSGDTGSSNEIRLAFLEKLDSLPSLQAAIASGSVSFDDYAAVLTSCTPEGHDRALFGDAFCSTRGPQEPLRQAFRRFTFACQALSWVGLSSVTPAWLYLALSRLLTPSEFDDFMQRPGVAPLLRTPYRESAEDHARRYGLLLDALSTFCDTPPWKDRTPVARTQAPASAGSSSAGTADPRPSPSSGGTDGVTATFGSGRGGPGGNAGGTKSGGGPGGGSSKGGGGGSRKGARHGQHTRAGAAAALGPAPCGGPELDASSDDDDQPPAPAAWAAAAAGTAVYNYTGNRDADAHTTQERVRRRLCLRCLPGPTPPHPFGACPLHDSRTGAPTCRPYPPA